MTRFALVVLVLVPFLAQAQSQQSRTLEMHLRAIQELAPEVAGQAQKHATVLNLLRDAARALDDWQTNKAVAIADQKVAEAKRLAQSRPSPSQRVYQAVLAAEDLIRPAKASSMEANLMKLREDMRAPIGAVAEVAAADAAELATLTRRTAELNALLSAALAEVANAAVDKKR
jgi:citrate synthase